MSAAIVQASPVSVWANRRGGVELDEMRFTPDEAEAIAALLLLRAKQAREIAADREKQLLFTIDFKALQAFNGYTD